MKNIITTILLLLTINLFSQTRKDVFDINKPNLKLLDSLLFEEAMKQRKLNNRKVIERDYICGLSAKYQSEYMSHYNVFEHENDKEFKGVLLKEHQDRFNHFLKKNKSKLKYRTFHEILVMLESVDVYNYEGIVSKTYENYAECLIHYYMTSPGHKATLLYDVDSGVMVCDFKSEYNQKTKSLYVTGFYSFAKE